MNPNRYGMITIILVVLICSLITNPTSGQQSQIDVEALKQDAPKVFLDCGMCDIDYIRTEITFINYVRDRKEAQIHLLVTSRTTGGGGREYTLDFIGQNKFEEIHDTQKYFSNKTDTADEIREGLVKAIKLGLMSYVAKTPIAERIQVSFREEEPHQEVHDRWKGWVFSLSGSGGRNGEKYYNSQRIRSSFSANRITEEFKIQMSVSAYNSKQEFRYEEETIRSTSDTYDFNGLFVKSLNDHWSIGAYLRASSSTFENIQFDFSPAPAIEYNVYPYSESSRRQLRILYRIGFHAVKYREETIYNKIKQNLFAESLSATLSLKEKWGSVSTTLAGSHYLHDFDKNRITLFSVLNFRLLKGLNLVLFGGGSRIHDQLSLVKGEASLEEVLLRRKQLETGYNYFVSVGFNFTFGSIFSNVVNPRFGSSGYGGLSIIVD